MIVCFGCVATRTEKTGQLYSTLWCDICRNCEIVIIGMKTFSFVWIDGSLNHLVSNVVDNVTSTQQLFLLWCYVTQSQRDTFVQNFSEKRFFGALMDGTTEQVQK